MRGRRWILIAGLAALIALPVIALAGTYTGKPLAGKWKVTVYGPPTNPKGSFKVTSDRKHVKSFSVKVVSGEGIGSCPTGTITVAGPLKLKKYSGGWAYLKIVGSGEGPRGVSAKLNGAPLANVAMLLQFGGTSIAAPKKSGNGHLQIGNTGTTGGCYYNLGTKH